MEELIQYDKQLLLWFNGSDSFFLDSLIMTLTNAKTWIPLYLGLFFVVVKTNMKSNTAVRDILLIMAAAGACVLLAGTHDPQIGALVDTVDGYRGGNYGFFSAHAANTFSIAIFFSLLMRQRLLTIFLVAWSLTNCYTRLYLGVHYPGDITVGLIWGGLVGFCVYKGYCRLTRPAVYTRELCYVPIAILCMTLLYAVVMALL